MQQTERGFTLLELMAAITVLGILFAMALPSFREISRNNRVSGAQNELVTALTLARSEALTRSTNVSVCSSKDGATCSGSNNWATGWIAFVDEGVAGTPDTINDVVVQAWPAVQGDTLLGGSDPFVRYSSVGMIADPAGIRTILVSSDKCVGPKARRVAVAVIGSVTSTSWNCP